MLYRLFTYVYAGKINELLYLTRQAICCKNYVTVSHARVNIVAGEKQ